MYRPRYLDTIFTDEFKSRLEAAKAILKSCTLCPRDCRVDRTKKPAKNCKTGAQPLISSYFAHFGEERPLVGSKGSGTIFISGCNLQCVFCQNFEISHVQEGFARTPEEFAGMMLGLQEKGCHNINIVTPTHIVPALMEALLIAANDGLNIPLVYNTSGYDKPETLKLLDGIVDIYMPDFKFFSDTNSRRYFQVHNYGSIAKEAILEMHRQVGNLKVEDGIATSGLLVRHLVMPGYLEESRKVFHFIAEQISPDTFINIMPQYFPAGRAHFYPEIDRRLYREEYLQALEIAKDAGLTRFSKEEF